MSVLKVENLFYTYGKNGFSLRNITLALDKGSLTLLLGPNGSGKSTLMKVLSGLLPFQKGKILLDEKELEPEELRRLCSYVFQNPTLQVVGSTVEEDIAFGLENMGVPRSEIVDRLNTVLEQFDLKKLRDRDPLTLSGGQRQRLAMASVVALGSRYLFLDEPMAMLDRMGRDEVLNSIELMMSYGVTILVSSHDLSNLMTLAEKVLLLVNGHLEAELSTLEFVNLDQLYVEIPISVQIAKRAAYPEFLHFIPTLEDLKWH